MACAALPACRCLPGADAAPVLGRERLQSRLRPGSPAYVSCFAGRWMREQPAVLSGLELVPGESGQLQEVCQALQHKCRHAAERAESAAPDPGCGDSGCCLCPVPRPQPEAQLQVCPGSGPPSFLPAAPSGQARRPPCRGIPDGARWPGVPGTSSSKAVSGLWGPRLSAIFQGLGALSKVSV